jgi:arylsulfatase A-like enzyme
MTSFLNIVMIVLDTQRVDRLSCYGYSQVVSPAIDALARDATCFDWAISPAQWTVPAHASMFTGLYPSQHTMVYLNSRLPDTLPVLAERLKQAGYVTACFSNNPLVGATSNGLQRGFDEVVNYHYAGFGLWTAHLDHVTFNNPRCVDRWRCALRRLTARLFGYDKAAYPQGLSKLIAPLFMRFIELKGGAKYKSTRASLRDAGQWLAQHANDSAPTFMFINLMGAHIPYAPPRWAMKRFLPEAMRAHTAYGLIRKANAIGLDVTNWVASEALSADSIALMHKMCDAEVTAQDAYLGEFFDWLRNRGLLDKTVLIVVSDHGDHLGEKQRFSHMFGAYRELVHVPLIIRDPLERFPNGQRIKPGVSTRCLFHTALDVAGIATPDEARLSLMTLALENESPPVVYAEALPPRWVVARLKRRRPDLFQEGDHDWTVRAMYKDGYKLLVGCDTQELYAVHDDPQELKEISARLPRKVAAMEAMLRAFESSVQPQGVAMVHALDADVATRLQDLGYL